MKTQSEIISEIKYDVEMTVKRLRYMYAGEHAGWLSHAAKLLLKVEDPELRVKLFLKIVGRTLTLLRRVDDSNASLQSTIWEGSYCFEVWKQICSASDESTLKAILQKIMTEDEDGLADGMFFPESALPIQDAVLRRLVDYVLGDLKFKDKYRKADAILGCLGWLAQLKDEAAFNELERHLPKCDLSTSWMKRFNLYLNLERYKDAIELAKTITKDSNPRHFHELCIRVFERSGDRDLLMQTAMKIARERPTIDEYKRLKPLLKDDERAKFTSATVESALGREGFDVPFCEVLFAAGELKALHSYAVSRYKEAFELNYCTGMIPLGKKLFKAGDPLAGCVFMRSAIYYLMCAGNSKYYPNVRKQMAILADMASAVTDWEGIETQEEFNAAFTSDFANRWSYWN